LNRLKFLKIMNEGYMFMILVNKVENRIKAQFTTKFKFTLIFYSGVGFEPRHQDESQTLYPLWYRNQYSNQNFLLFLKFVTS